MNKSINVSSSEFSFDSNTNNPLIKENVNPCSMNLINYYPQVEQKSISSFPDRCFGKSITNLQYVHPYIPVTKCDNYNNFKVLNPLLISKDLLIEDHKKLESNHDDNFEVQNKLKEKSVQDDLITKESLHFDPPNALNLDQNQNLVNLRNLSQQESIISKVKLNLPKLFKKTVSQNINLPELEYINDIYSSLISEENLKENQNFLNFDYMKCQNELSPRTRAILVSFMMDLTIMFKFKIKTLFLSVQIMDKILSKEKISSYYFQLVCVGCVFVAAKFEEIYYPEISEWLQFSNGNYTHGDLLDMENLILKSLDYNILPLNQFSFFEIASRKLGLYGKELYLGHMILEMSLFEYALVKYKKSVISECVIFMIMRSIKNKNINYKYNFNLDNDDWTQEAFCDIYDNSEEHRKEIEEVYGIICTLMANINCPIFKSVYAKYSQREFYNVTNYNIFV